MATKTWLILLTDFKDAKGGIPAFNRFLVEAWRDIAARQGWQLRILVLHDHNSPENRPPMQYQPFASHRMAFVRAALRAAGDSDAVFFGHVHLAPLALFMRVRERWLVAHGIEVWGPLGWLRRWGLSRMTRILCVSRYTRDQLVQRHKVPVDRTRIFPNTARVALQETTENGTRTPGRQGLQILTVSRLWPQEHYKKIDRVIEALPAVLSDLPETRYVIVGDGADRPRLESFARKLGVERQVTFAGAVTDEELHRQYAACDVFVLPSLGEGFGIVFLEAMACAKPCIGAAAGAVPEVIEEGRTGFVVKPDNAAAITDALIRLLSNPELRRSMGQSGQKLFQAEFAFERFRQRLAQYLNEGAVR